MAKPEEKAPEVDALINSISGNDRVESIEGNKCAVKWHCDGTADKFRDAKSAREYTISGICQVCQDKFFG